MRTQTDKRIIKLAAVVIGASAGGANAIRTILQSLPHNFTLPVIIVQHLHPDSDDYLAQALNEKCKVTVKQASEKEKIEPGVVYIAPPNYHLLIEDDMSFSLSITERVRYARPSIDVLFETAADVFGANLIGIILTGGNNDGSVGLKRIKEMGGVAVVQDPSDAEADSMPREAIAATKVDYILSLEKIGPFLVKIASKLEDKPKREKRKKDN